MINYPSTGVSAAAKIYICRFTHRNFTFYDRMDNRNK